LLLLRTSRVCRTASVQQTIGITAAELLEKSNRETSSGLMPRCESENKCILLLFHAATARLTT
jgi:hypothetical protein